MHFEKGFVIKAVIMLQIMKTSWQDLQFLISCVCCFRWCTLFGFLMTTPGISSSVITLSTGNFRTTGTNVKIERLDGTPIETCKTQRGETNCPHYALSTTISQYFPFAAPTFAYLIIMIQAQWEFFTINKQARDHIELPAKSVTLSMSFCHSWTSVVEYLISLWLTGLCNYTPPLTIHNHTHTQIRHFSAPQFKAWTHPTHWGE